MTRVILFTVLGLAAASGLNPITRVVQLMEGLTTKVKADGENEQELYDGFKCWCKKVITSKTASIAANEQRIEELSKYLDDLSSGAVELTSERTDLETEIKKLEAGIKEATDMRAQELKDFTAAKEELDQSITALEGAVAEMSTKTEGMDGSAPSMMLSTFHSHIRKVMKVGANMLSESDVEQLHKLLDVPEYDNEKLNRDAGFKQKYEKRSGEIQDILGEMLTTFKDNRDEAVAAEATAVENSEALLLSKNNELEIGQTAQRDKSVENGARDSESATFGTEKTNLETQNTDDTRFIEQTKATCAHKATEWAARKELRAGELAAIAQAIAVLRSDDARDLFKKSYDSQSFLQTRIRRSPSRKNRAMRNNAALLMRHTAVKSGDMRLATIASKIENDENPLDYSEVITSLQGMIDDLKIEEASDMTTKKDCQDARMVTNRELGMLAKNIDTNTETSDRLMNAMDSGDARIKEVEAEIKEYQDNLQAATDQRAKEAAEALQAASDDTAAAGLVADSMGVLKNFYESKSLALGLAQYPAEVEGSGAGGDAPTPPPSTWETAEYGGATGESNGVIQMMEIVKADIEKDIAKAAAEEQAAIDAFDALSLDINNAIAALGVTKGALEGTKGEDAQKRADEISDRSVNQGIVTAKLHYLKGMAGGCDFMLQHFETRMANRQSELDGLDKAKAIFGGAGGQ